MRVLVAAALLLSQPEPPGASVEGTVLRHDGSPAGGSRVTLQCGDWRREHTAAADGRFVFTAVPERPCVLMAHDVGDATSGVSLDVPEHRSALILPASLTRSGAVETPTSSGLKLELASQTGVLSTPTRSTRVSGAATWTSGLENAAVGARPDQWAVGASISRPGPWGTLLTGSASARRVSGATTLLSDVTGVPALGSGMWSALFDPSRTMVWDVRLGLQKQWKVGTTDLTLFGDAYRSFQGGTTGNGLMPLPESATKGLRAGTAGRVGVKLGF